MLSEVGAVCLLHCRVFEELEVLLPSVMWRTTASFTGRTGPVPVPLGPH